MPEKPLQPSLMADPNLSVGDINVDVLIIGGGFAGGTLAAALGDTSLKVCMVDRADPRDALDATFDGRAFAISQSNQKLLQGTGLWPLLAETSAPILDIRVSDGPSLLFLHYDHQTVGAEPMGYMIENHHLRVALHERLKAQPGLTQLAPGQVVTLERDGGRVRAELSDGRRVRARLAVGADGRGSDTRVSAGIELTQWSYRQTGIVCTVRHECSHDYVAQERFLPAGPFAILPLMGDTPGAANRSSIVWTEREDLAPAMMTLDDDVFAQELNRRFGSFLGKVEVIGPRWAYPLSLQYARETIATRLVLIGDAAHGMHPIAGQGLNMGLRDVAALAEVLADAARLGLDIGGAATLERYERWRRFDNTMMLAATDALNRLFSNDIAPIRLARDAGLGIVNSIPPLKRLFMRHAMGSVGDLPRLLRGERL
jgi:2-octaprenyl-6-methoxyphenol hydroxylase